MTANRNENVTGYYDVDSTLAAIVGPQLRLYSDFLELGLPPALIQQLTEAEINVREDRLRRTFRKKGDDVYIPPNTAEPYHDPKYFAAVREAILNNEVLHLSFPVIAQATLGVQTLFDEFGFGGYLTVRQPQVEESTREWLRENYFPDPEAVIIATSSEEKIWQMLLRNGLLLQGEDGGLSKGGSFETVERVYLIDDGPDSLVKAAKALLSQRNPQDRQLMESAYEKLLLVGFGFSEEEIRQEHGLQGSPIHVWGLPNWQPESVNALARRISAQSNRGGWFTGPNGPGKGQ